MSEIRIYSKYGCHICLPMVLADITATGSAEDKSDDSSELPEVDTSLFED